MPVRMQFENRRRQRHAEAVTRQQEYDTLTTEQKIARAEARPGNSAKELARLRA